MNELFQFIFNIFVLAIISTFIDNLTVSEKLTKYIKPAVSVVIILSIVGFITQISLNEDLNLDSEKFIVDTQSVWDEQSKLCEQLLEKEMLNDCFENNINVSDIDVKVSYKENNFNVDSVKITGTDKFSAKNYISGKYRIGLAYINTDGE